MVVTYRNGKLVPAANPSPQSRTPSGRGVSAPATRTHLPSGKGRAPIISASRRAAVPCIHLGTATGEAKDCLGCGGTKDIPLYRCGVHGECTTTRVLTAKDDGITRRYAFCLSCADYTSIPTPSSPALSAKPSAPLPNAMPGSSPVPIPPPARPRVGPLRWTYGLTTVPQRRDNLLPRTLASLKAAGFDRPRLFVDGVTHDTSSSYEQQFGLEVTSFYPQLRIVGAWMLTLWELWVRDPKAERYAIFQDDFVSCRGLREYLNYATVGARTPPKVYWNLYTARWNEKAISGRGSGWHEGSLSGSDIHHGKTSQRGAGAVALVFDAETVIELLSSRSLVEKPMVAGQSSYSLIDGGIVTALNKIGWREVCHNPSLVQHTGLKSAIGHHNQKQAQTFEGETWDATSLIE